MFKRIDKKNSQFHSQLFWGGGGGGLMVDIHIIIIVT